MTRQIGALIFMTCLAGLSAGEVPVPSLDRFTPGATWPDDQGTPINAHAGGILRHDGVYYWFGQHMSEGRGGTAARVGVRVYSSRDLYNWKDEGVALRVSDDPESDIVGGCAIERPKVLYHEDSGTFVMWFHLELKGQGYRAARSGVAVADEVTGPYRFLGSFRPNGQMARDMTLFKDDDGSAWLFCASEDNATMHVVPLTDDYLKPAGTYQRIFVGEYREAPAVFKRKGRYYLLTSGCSGWRPNAARCAVADTLDGPWKELGNPCVVDGEQVPDEEAMDRWRDGLDEPVRNANLTFGGQSTFVLPVEGKDDAYIAMFDLWRPRDPIDGRYMWLPVEFDGERVRLRPLKTWDLSVFD